MAIIIKKIQRIDPRDKNAAKKWYPVQKRTEMVDEISVAELLADETTLNPMEALMSIRQLKKIILRSLLDGKSVKLGDWGSFTVRLETTGADTAETLTAANVKRVKIGFNIGSEMKAAMQGATFVWAENLTKSSSSSSSSDDSSSDGGSGSENNPL